MLISEWRGGSNTWQKINCYSVITVIDIIRLFLPF